MSKVRKTLVLRFFQSILKVIFTAYFVQLSCIRKILVLSEAKINLLNVFAMQN